MMRWTYDANAGAFYLYLAEGQSVRQAELPDGIVVDISAAGVPLGVEMVPPRPLLDRAPLTALGVEQRAIDLLAIVGSGQLPTVRTATGSMGEGSRQEENTVDVEMVLTS